MYYEFYIDQFFLEQLLTGILLIRLTGTMEHIRIHPARILLAGTLNAVLMVLAVCLNLRPGLYGGFIAAGIAAFGERKKHWIRKRLPGFFLTTLLFCGSAQALSYAGRLPVLWCGILVYVVLTLLAAVFWKERKEAQTSVYLRLCWNKREVQAEGIIDTGNRLQEPFTGRPVSILDESVAKRLLEDGWEQEKGFYLIPYHSIGEDAGWMKGITLDCMYMKQQGKECCVNRPVFAISPGRAANQRDYHVILHPSHAMYLSNQ